MSYPTGSIPLSGAIGTTAASDAFPTHYDHLGYGGMRSVADNLARDAIPLARRAFGMLVFSVAENKLYKLSNAQMGGGSNSLNDNANWIEFSAASVGGEDGKSAYQIALDNGFQGSESEWLSSLVGAQGPSGAKGDQGDVGPAGPQGEVGPSGPQGPQGSQGLKGDQGEAGPAGPQGPQGAVGPSGPQGDVGPAGKAFQISKVYSSLAALQGDVNPSGISSGEFAIISTGNVNDVDNAKLYLWNGSSYSYVTDLSGAEGMVGPTGATGSQGPQGEAGPQGPQGLKGDKGDQGDVGPAGPQGPQGSPGVAGPTGAQGPQGSSGFSEMMFSISGLPNSSAVYQVVMGRNSTVTAASTKYARAQIAGTVSDATFTISKNGLSIGSILFSSGSVNGTFTFNSDVSFVAGDVISITAPSTQNPTLANISITIPMSI